MAFTTLTAIFVTPVVIMSMAVSDEIKSKGIYNELF